MMLEVSHVFRVCIRGKTWRYFRFFIFYWSQPAVLLPQNLRTFVSFIYLEPVSCSTSSKFTAFRFFLSGGSQLFCFLKTHGLSFFYLSGGSQLLCFLKTHSLSFLFIWSHPAVSLPQNPRPFLYLSWSLNLS